MTSFFLLAALVWALIGLAVWVWLVVDSRYVTVGELVALPLMMLIGAGMVLILIAAAIIDKWSRPVLLDWRKDRRRS